MDRADGYSLNPLGSGRAGIESRELGAKGMRISRIVFGSGAVGGIIFEAEMTKSKETVKCALSHGVNWFDNPRPLMETVFQSRDS